jgi:uncharacterized membrane protein YfcA
MSRWLKQGSAWQYFVIVLAITVPAVLVGAVLVAVVSFGHWRTDAFEFISFGSLWIATAATLGRQKRKRAQAERAAAQANAQET